MSEDMHEFEEQILTAIKSDPWPLEGKKNDTGKMRMDLIPEELLIAVSSVLTFGAKKYNDRNWEKGMKWGRIFGALMRHSWAWWNGKMKDKLADMGVLPRPPQGLYSKDEETGYSHLWHAACCITFLLTYEMRQIGEDDRAE